MKKLSLALVVVICLVWPPITAHSTSALPFVKKVTVDRAGNDALDIFGQNLCTTPTPTVTLADTQLVVQNGSTASEIVANFPAQTPVSNFNEESYFLRISCGWTFAIFDVALGSGLAYPLTSLGRMTELQPASK